MTRNIKYGLDEGCGLDGHGRHNWRYGGSDTYVVRKCAFCLECQKIKKVIWVKEYE